MAEQPIVIKVVADGKTYDVAIPREKWTLAGEVVMHPAPRQVIAVFLIRTPDAPDPKVQSAIVLTPGAARDLWNGLKNAKKQHPSWFEPPQVS